jgi:hypothetical protein
MRQIHQRRPAAARDALAARADDARRWLLMMVDAKHEAFRHMTERRIGGAALTRRSQLITPEDPVQPCQLRRLAANAD